MARDAPYGFRAGGNFIYSWTRDPKVGRTGGETEFEWLPPAPRI